MTTVATENPYEGREQTLAKHVILKGYLQALAFKILQSPHEVLTYVDGFSGPWRAQTESFSDTSFMIAINVLKDAQNQIFKATGKRKTIRCLLIEKDAAAHQKLGSAVSIHNDPASKFSIETLHGEFEEATDRIVKCVGNSFALVFIDPTGWTGYAYDRIKPVLQHRPGEVLINFMYDHANRFAMSGDPTIEASFEPIMGGSGWRDRLDQSMDVGQAVEKLFRDELKNAGGFKFVTTTRINKPLVERTHFIMAYGTRHDEGLKTFREVEYKALREHERTRAIAKESKEVKATGQARLFTAAETYDDRTIDEEVIAHRHRAKQFVLQQLTANGNSLLFSRLVALVLESFMLRTTNVKDVCVELAQAGTIMNTWKDAGRKKPSADAKCDDLIVLAPTVCAL